MEDNIFILSDASYSSQNKLAGLGVVDTFSQKRYKMCIKNISSALEAEFYALALSVKIAIKNKYTNVVFVYDCKSLEIDSLQEYVEGKIKNVQFLWLKRKYLKESDSLAKKARKLIENLNISKATKKDIENIETKALLEKNKNFFSSFSTKIKLKAAMHIANEREKEILTGFLSSSSINLNVKTKLGTKKGTFIKFVYSILTKEDQIDFLNYLTYVNPDLNKKSFRKQLDKQTINNYLNRIYNQIKNKEKKNEK